MRPLLGPLWVHGALLSAGLGVLRITGVIACVRSRQALAAAGLAYLAGVVCSLALCVLVLVLGGPFTLATFGVIAAALSVPLLLDLRRPGRPGPRPSGRVLRAPGPGQLAVGLTLGALAALALVGLATLSNRPIAPPHVDPWHLYARRALLLFYSPHLPARVLSFAGDFRYQPHYNINPTYPLMWPLLEALHMRALGRPDPSSVHLVVWLLGIAFVWAGGFLAARVTAAIVWAPVLAGALVLSMGRLLSGDADIPLGYFLALGALSLGIWLRSGERRDLVVAVVLLAGAAAIKDEGTPGALVILAAGLGSALFSRSRRAALELATAALALVAIAIMPWRLWVAAHSLQSEQPLGRTVDPGFLAGHVSRVPHALAALGAGLANLDGPTVFVVLGLAIVVACAWERRDRDLAAFYLLAGLGYVVTLVWAYWVTIVPFAWQLRTSVDRVVDGPAFIALAAILQLAVAGPQPARPGSSRAGSSPSSRYSAPTACTIGPAANRRS